MGLLIDKGNMDLEKQKEDLMSFSKREGVVFDIFFEIPFHKENQIQTVGAFLKKMNSKDTIVYSDIDIGNSYGILQIIEQRRVKFLSTCETFRPARRDKKNNSSVRPYRSQRILEPLRDEIKELLSMRLRTESILRIVNSKLNKPVTSMTLRNYLALLKPHI